MATSKLNCSVPKRVATIISRVRVRTSAKNKALKHLMALALKDKGRFDVAKADFGDEKVESCTIDMNDDDYEKTESYRDRYLLTTKVDFFLHALKHGAALWEKDNPPAE